MKNDTYYDIDTTSSEVVSIIRDDANSFKTCHLCGQNKPHMMFSFLLFKLDRVERDFGDYAAFVGMGALSALSLFARGHSKVMSRVPGDRFYQMIPLHLGVCKGCIEKKTNWRGKLVFKESDYKKHPLYPKAKELGYKKVAFQESYTTEDLVGKSFQKDLTKIRKLVEEMDSGLNTQLKNDDYLDNNLIDMSTKIYDEYGFDKDGYNREGYDAYGYDREGFNKEGWNKKGYDRNGYDEDGFNVKGYDEDGYDREGYNVEGLDRQGFNKEGWNKKGINKKTGTEYGKDGFDKDGYNERGYNCLGYDKNGYDRSDFNSEGINRLTKTKFGVDGYDKDGYDKDGFDVNGKNRAGGFRDKKAKREAHIESYGCFYFFGFVVLFVIIMAILSSIYDW